MPLATVQWGAHGSKIGAKNKQWGKEELAMQTLKNEAIVLQPDLKLTFHLHMRAGSFCLCCLNSKMFCLILHVPTDCLHMSSPSILDHSLAREPQDANWFLSPLRMGEDPKPSKKSTHCFKWAETHCCPKSLLLMPTVSRLFLTYISLNAQ